ncbi:hypothetical protein P4200_22475 [Pseudomonas aeruginosa]|nr:hypothetical protein [Pseudomonas aeruginosa]
MPNVCWYLLLLAPAASRRAMRLLWPTPEGQHPPLRGPGRQRHTLPEPAAARDARVSYQLSADLPDLQQADRGTLRLALQAAARRTR